ncbi:MAG: class I SAM-dependent methyltransferase [Tannerella sp.]|jgi:2-polyprenyl-3-methyl-5-hydroxy-6-metoxy-1,4-benzoquinol methylase|nr:class I SAM-dependent methyltransferase [Tannerella sp.]
MRDNNIWNDAFRNENLIWGTEPSEAAKITEKLFSEHHIKTVLVTGAGYGRNAKYFSDKGYIVDGIEYSTEAIEMGKTFAPKVNFICRSILDDYNTDKKYDGIFCHSFIHLFKRNERRSIIKRCVENMNDNGIIMVSCCTREHAAYGAGILIEENTYEIKDGLVLHFYDEKELEHIHDKLEPVEIGTLSEEYKFIYGIFKIRKS